MNKYYIRIPYSYTQYADLSGFVYAEDREEAEELAADSWNIHEEEYQDCDSSGDSEYDYAEMEITLEESEISIEDIPARNNPNQNFSFASGLPNHFLDNLPALLAF